MVSISDTGREHPRDGEGAKKKVEKLAQRQPETNGNPIVCHEMDVSSLAKTTGPVRLRNLGLINSFNPCKGREQD